MRTASFWLPLGHFEWFSNYNIVKTYYLEEITIESFFQFGGNVCPCDIMTGTKQTFL